MATKTSLTIQNLEALGGKRLAELLMDVAATDAAMKRRLRLELAAETAPRKLAAEVRKRLVSFARGHSFVDRRQARAFAAELDSQRRMIVDRVAKIDAAEALDLLWQFMELAEPVHERADDSDGALGNVFAVACDDLGALTQSARPDPLALADRAFDALQDNGYGQYDGLIENLAPSLGKEGLDRLKALVVELSKEPVARPPQKERAVVGWGMNGPLYRDELEKSSRKSLVTRTLKEIADVQGDVDGFIAQYDDKARKVPNVAALIARRLLAAGRAEEALATLDAAIPRPHDRPGWGWDWENVRIDALEALGRREEAQAVRWSCFETELSVDHLRAYLKALPDFDDVQAEEQALDHADRHPDLLQALSFLISWRALDRAARIVTGRTSQLDGNFYEVLSPAADALAGKYPLAATLVLRAMIDFALGKARSGRYKHAARHLTDCSGLAARVSDWGSVETHEAYIARLKAAHGRKTAFWIEVD